MVYYLVHRCSYTYNNEASLPLLYSSTFTWQVSNEERPGWHAFKQLKQYILRQSSLTMTVQNAVVKDGYAQVVSFSS